MKLRGAIAIAAAAVFAAVPALAGSTTSLPTTGKIVYTSLKDGQADIYSMDVNGKNAVNISHDKTIGVRADVQPVWSPGGHFVAFEREYTKAGAELMIVKADGTQLHSLIPTQSRGIWSCHPSWSKQHHLLHEQPGRQLRALLRLGDREGPHAADPHGRADPEPGARGRSRREVRGLLPDRPGALGHDTALPVALRHDRHQPAHLELP
jgi:hypothetical protein